MSAPGGAFSRRTRGLKLQLSGLKLRLGHQDHGFEVTLEPDVARQLARDLERNADHVEALADQAMADLEAITRGGELC